MRSFGSGKRLFSRRGKRRARKVFMGELPLFAEVSTVFLVRYEEKNYFCLKYVISGTMTVSKTRIQLVDVARQLFARMGVENTTMNDIALASKKGRRTLYTYFKSKEEIYWAVVESELEILLDMMRRVAEEDIPPEKKIMAMIYTRLDAVKEVVYRNGTLRADFFRDIWQVEKVRKKFDAKEMMFFKAVLQEGREKGVFQVDDVEMTAKLLHYCLKGVEVPYIRGQIGGNLDAETRDRYVSNIVLGALGGKRI